MKRKLRYIVLPVVLAQLASCGWAAPLVVENAKPGPQVGGVATLDYKPADQTVPGPSVSAPATYRTASPERAAPPVPGPLIPISNNTYVPREASYPEVVIHQQQEIDDMLADGRVHNINVLFKDKYKIRLTRGKDQLLKFEVDGTKADASEERSRAIEALAQVLRKYELGEIRNPFPETLGKSEAALLADEAQREAANGVDTAPNLGSFALLTWKTYSKEAARELIAALQKLEVVSEVHPEYEYQDAAVVYGVTPSDPKFPDTSTPWWTQEDLYSFKVDDIHDPDYTNQDFVESWWYNRHSFAAISSSVNGSGVRVAVIDSAHQIASASSQDSTGGVNIYNVGLGRNSTSSGLVTTGIGPADRSGEQIWHGTTTSQLIKGQRNNGIGLCGVAPNVDLVPIRYNGTGSTVAAAVNYASGTDCNAKVITLSIGPLSGGNLESDSTVRTAFRTARDRGATVVYAAGNSRTQISYQSSSFTDAICVGGIDKHNQFYDYVPPAGGVGSGSNWGTRVDIAAAAERISAGSLDLDRTTFKTRKVMGTSFAAPLVAGAVALMRQSATLTPYEVRDVLIGTADLAYGINFNVPNVGRQMSAGYNGTEGWSKIRVLNAHAAVTIASNYLTSLPVTCYKPASDAYAQIESLQGGSIINGWHPNNYHMRFPRNHRFKTLTYSDGGVWASAQSVFLNRRLQYADVSGTPFELCADGTPLVGTYSTTGNSNTWVDPHEYIVY